MPDLYCFECLICSALNAWFAGRFLSCVLCYAGSGAVFIATATCVPPLPWVFCHCHGCAATATSVPPLPWVYCHFHVHTPLPWVYRHCHGCTATATCVRHCHGCTATAMGVPPPPLPWVYRHRHRHEWTATATCVCVLCPEGASAGAVAAAPGGAAPCEQRHRQSGAWLYCTWLYCGSTSGAGGCT